MDKAEHAARLRTAMAERRLSRTTVADAVEVKVRTVTNWTTGETLPAEQDRIKLRNLLGPYDQTGDPVEVAIRRSGLSEWRQDILIGTYKKHLYEQGEERTG